MKLTNALLNLAKHLQFTTEFKYYAIIYTSKQGIIRLKEARERESEGNVLVINEVPDTVNNKLEWQEKMMLWGPLILNVVADCTGTVAFAVASGGEAVAIPFTAGASSAALPFTVLAASAAAYKCGTSSGELVNQIAAPENNKILAGSRLYNFSKDTADFIGVIDSARGIVKSFNSFMGLKKISAYEWKSLVPSLKKGLNYTTRANFALELKGVRGVSKANVWKALKGAGVKKVLSNSELQHFAHESLVELVKGLCEIYSSTQEGSLNHGGKFVIELAKGAKKTQTVEGQEHLRFKPFEPKF